MSLREGVSMHRRPTPQPTHIVPKQSTHHFTPQFTHGKVLTVAPESNTLGTRSTPALGPGSSLSSLQSHLHHHPPIRQSHHAVHGKQLISPVDSDELTRNDNLVELPHHSASSNNLLYDNVIDNRTELSSQSLGKKSQLKTSHTTLALAYDSQNHDEQTQTHSHTLTLQDPTIRMRRFLKSFTSIKFLRGRLKPNVLSPVVPRNRIKSSFHTLYGCLPLVTHSQQRSSFHTSATYHHTISRGQRSDHQRHQPPINFHTRGIYAKRRESPYKRSPGTVYMHPLIYKKMTGKSQITSQNTDLSKFYYQNNNNDVRLEVHSLCDEYGVTFDLLEWAIRHHRGDIFVEAIRILIAHVLGHTSPKEDTFEPFDDLLDERLAEASFMHNHSARYGYRKHETYAYVNIGINQSHLTALQFPLLAQIGKCKSPYIIEVMRIIRHNQIKSLEHFDHLLLQSDVFLLSEQLNTKFIEELEHQKELLDLEITVDTILHGPEHLQKELMEKEKKKIEEERHRQTILTGGTQPTPGSLHSFDILEKNLSPEQIKQQLSSQKTEGSTRKNELMVLSQSNQDKLLSVTHPQSAKLDIGIISEGSFSKPTIVDIEGNTFEMDGPNADQTMLEKYTKYDSQGYALPKRVIQHILLMKVFTDLIKDRMTTSERLKEWLHCTCDQPHANDREVVLCLLKPIEDAMFTAVEFADSTLPSSIELSRHVYKNTKYPENMIYSHQTVMNDSDNTRLELYNATIGELCCDSLLTLKTFVPRDYFIPWLNRGVVADLYLRGQYETAVRLLGFNPDDPLATRQSGYSWDICDAVACFFVAYTNEDYIMTEILKQEGYTLDVVTNLLSMGGTMTKYDIRGSLRISDNISPLDLIHGLVQRLFSTSNLTASIAFLQFLNVWSLDEFNAHFAIPIQPFNVAVRSSRVNEIMLRLLTFRDATIVANNYMGSEHNSLFGLFTTHFIDPQRAMDKARFIVDYCHAIQKPPSTFSLTIPERDMYAFARAFAEGKGEMMIKDPHGFAKAIAVNQNDEEVEYAKSLVLKYMNDPSFRDQLTQFRFSKLGYQPDVLRQHRSSREFLSPEDQERLGVAPYAAPSERRKAYHPMYDEHGNEIPQHDHGTTTEEEMYDVSKPFWLRGVRNPHPYKEAEKKKKQLQNALIEEADKQLHYTGDIDDEVKELMIKHVPFHKIEGNVRLIRKLYSRPPEEVKKYPSPVEASPRFQFARKKTGFKIGDVELSDMSYNEWNSDHEKFVKKVQQRTEEIVEQDEYDLRMALEERGADIARYYGHAPVKPKSYIDAELEDETRQREKEIVPFEVLLTQRKAEIESGEYRTNVVDIHPVEELEPLPLVEEFQREQDEENETMKKEPTPFKEDDSQKPVIPVEELEAMTPEDIKNDDDLRKYVLGSRMLEEVANTDDELEELLADIDVKNINPGILEKLELFTDLEKIDLDLSDDEDLAMLQKYKSIIRLKRKRLRKYIKKNKQIYDIMSDGDKLVESAYIHKDRQRKQHYTQQLHERRRAGETGVIPLEELKRLDYDPHDTEMWSKLQKDEEQRNKRLQQIADEERQIQAEIESGDTRYASEKYSLSNQRRAGVKLGLDRLKSGSEVEGDDAYFNKEDEAEHELFEHRREQIKQDLDPEGTLYHIGPDGKRIANTSDDLNQFRYVQRNKYDADDRLQFYEENKMGIEHFDPKKLKKEKMKKILHDDDDGNNFKDGNDNINEIDIADDDDDIEISDTEPENIRTTTHIPTVEPEVFDPPPPQPSDSEHRPPKVIQMAPVSVEHIADDELIHNVVHNEKLSRREEFESIARGPYDASMTLYESTLSRDITREQRLQKKLQLQPDYGLEALLRDDNGDDKSVKDGVQKQKSPSQSRLDTILAEYEAKHNTSESSSQPSSQQSYQSHQGDVQSQHHHVQFKDQSGSDDSDGYYNSDKTPLSSSHTYKTSVTDTTTTPNTDPDHSPLFASTTTSPSPSTDSDSTTSGIKRPPSLADTLERHALKVLKKKSEQDKKPKESQSGADGKDDKGATDDQTKSEAQRRKDLAQAELNRLKKKRSKKETRLYEGKKISPTKPQPDIPHIGTTPKIFKDLDKEDSPDVDRQFSGEEEEVDEFMEMKYLPMPGQPTKAAELTYSDLLAIIRVNSRFIDPYRIKLILEELLDPASRHIIKTSPSRVLQLLEPLLILNLSSQDEQHERLVLDRLYIVQMFINHETKHLFIPRVTTIVQPDGSFKRVFETVQDEEALIEELLDDNDPNDIDLAQQTKSRLRADQFNPMKFTAVYSDVHLLQYFLQLGIPVPTHGIINILKQINTHSTSFATTLTSKALTPYDEQLIIYEKLRQRVIARLQSHNHYVKLRNGGNGGNDQSPESKELGGEDDSQMIEQGAKVDLSKPQVPSPSGYVENEPSNKPLMVSPLATANNETGPATQIPKRFGWENTIVAPLPKPNVPIDADSDVSDAPSSSSSTDPMLADIFKNDRLHYNIEHPEHESYNKVINLQDELMKFPEIAEIFDQEDAFELFLRYEVNVRELIFNHVADGPQKDKRSEILRILIDAHSPDQLNHQTKILQKPILDALALTLIFPFFAILHDRFTFELKTDVVEQQLLDQFQLKKGEYHRKIELIEGNEWFEEFQNLHPPKSPHNTLSPHTVYQTKQSIVHHQETPPPIDLAVMSPEMQLLDRYDEEQLKNMKQYQPHTKAPSSSSLVNDHDADDFYYNITSGDEDIAAKDMDDDPLMKKKSASDSETLLHDLLRDDYNPHTPPTNVPYFPLKPSSPAFQTMHNDDHNDNDLAVSDEDNIAQLKKKITEQKNIFAPRSPDEGNKQDDGLDTNEHTSSSEDKTDDEVATILREKLTWDPDVRYRTIADEDREYIEVGDFLAYYTDTEMQEDWEQKQSFADLNPQEELPEKDLFDSEDDQFFYGTRLPTPIRERREQLVESIKNYDPYITEPAATPAQNPLSSWNAPQYNIKRSRSQLKEKRNLLWKLSMQRKTFNAQIKDIQRQNDPLHKALTNEDNTNDQDKKSELMAVEYMPDGQRILKKIPIIDTPTEAGKHYTYGSTIDIIEQSSTLQESNSQRLTKLDTTANKRGKQGSSSTVSVESTPPASSFYKAPIAQPEEPTQIYPRHEHLQQQQQQQQDDQHGSQQPHLHQGSSPQTDIGMTTLTTTQQQKQKQQQHRSIRGIRVNLPQFRQYLYEYAENFYNDPLFDEKRNVAFATTALQDVGIHHMSPEAYAFHKKHNFSPAKFLQLDEPSSTDPNDDDPKNKDNDDKEEELDVEPIRKFVTTLNIDNNPVIKQYLKEIGADKPPGEEQTKVEGNESTSPTQTSTSTDGQSSPVNENTPALPKFSWRKLDKLRRDVQRLAKTVNIPRVPEIDTINDVFNTFFSIDRLQDDSFFTSPSSPSHKTFIEKTKRQHYDITMNHFLSTYFDRIQNVSVAVDTYRQYYVKSLSIQHWLSNSSIEIDHDDTSFIIIRSNLTLPHTSSSIHTPTRTTRMLFSDAQLVPPPPSTFIYDPRHIQLFADTLLDRIAPSKAVQSVTNIVDERGRLFFPPALRQILLQLQEVSEAIYAKHVEENSLDAIDATFKEARKQLSFIEEILDRGVSTLVKDPLMKDPVLEKHLRDTRKFILKVKGAMMKQIAESPEDVDYGSIDASEYMVNSITEFLARQKLSEDLQQKLGTHVDLNSNFLARKFREMFQAGTDTGILHVLQAVSQAEGSYHGSDLRALDGVIPLVEQLVKRRQDQRKAEQGGVDGDGDDDEDMIDNKQYMDDVRLVIDFLLRNVVSKQHNTQQDSDTPTPPQTQKTSSQAQLALPSNTSIIDSFDRTAKLLEFRRADQAHQPHADMGQALLSFLQGTDTFLWLATSAPQQIPVFINYIIDHMEKASELPFGVFRLPDNLESANEEEAEDPEERLSKLRQLIFTSENLPPTFNIPFITQKDGESTAYLDNSPFNYLFHQLTSDYRQFALDLFVTSQLIPIIPLSIQEKIELNTVINTSHAFFSKRTIFEYHMLLNALCEQHEIDLLSLMQPDSLFGTSKQEPASSLTTNTEPMSKLSTPEDIQRHAAQLHEDNFIALAYLRGLEIDNRVTELKEKIQSLPVDTPSDEITSIQSQISQLEDEQKKIQTNDDTWWGNHLEYYNQHLSHQRRSLPPDIQTVLFLIHGHEEFYRDNYLAYNKELRRFEDPIPNSDVFGVAPPGFMPYQKLDLSVDLSETACRIKQLQHKALFDKYNPLIYIKDRQTLVQMKIDNLLESNTMGQKDKINLEKYRHLFSNYNQVPTLQQIQEKTRDNDATTSSTTHLGNPGDPLEVKPEHIGGAYALPNHRELQQHLRVLRRQQKIALRQQQKNETFIDVSPSGDEGVPVSSQSSLVTLPMHELRQLYDAIIDEYAQIGAEARQQFRIAYILATKITLHDQYPILSTIYDLYEVDTVIPQPPKMIEYSPNTKKSRATETSATSSLHQTSQTPSPSSQSTHHSNMTAPDANDTSISPLPTQVQPSPSTTEASSAKPSKEPTNDKDNKDGNDEQSKPRLIPYVSSTFLGKITSLLKRDTSKTNQEHSSQDQSPSQQQSHDSSSQSPHTETSMADQSDKPHSSRKAKQLPVGSVPQPDLSSDSDNALQNLQFDIERSDGDDEQTDKDLSTYPGQSDDTHPHRGKNQPGNMESTSLGMVSSPTPSKQPLTGITVDEETGHTIIRSVDDFFANTDPLPDTIEMRDDLNDHHPNAANLMEQLPSSEKNLIVELKSRQKVDPKLFGDGTQTDNNQGKDLSPLSLQQQRAKIAIEQERMLKRHHRTDAPSRTKSPKRVADTLGERPLPFEHSSTLSKESDEPNGSVPLESIFVDTITQYNIVSHETPIARKRDDDRLNQRLNLINPPSLIDPDDLAASDTDQGPQDLTHPPKVTQKYLEEQKLLANLAGDDEIAPLYSNLQPTINVEDFSDFHSDWDMLRWADLEKQRRELQQLEKEQIRKMNAIPTEEQIKQMTEEDRKKHFKRLETDPLYKMQINLFEAEYLVDQKETPQTKRLLIETGYGDFLNDEPKKKKKNKHGYNNNNDDDESGSSSSSDESTASILLRRAEDNMAILLGDSSTPNMDDEDTARHQSGMDTNNNNNTKGEISETDKENTTNDKGTSMPSINRYPSELEQRQIDYTKSVTPPYKISDPIVIGAMKLKQYVDALSENSLNIKVRDIQTHNMLPYNPQQVLTKLIQRAHTIRGNPLMMVNYRQMIQRCVHDIRAYNSDTIVLKVPHSERSKHDATTVTTTRGQKIINDITLLLIDEIEHFTVTDINIYDIMLHNVDFITSDYILEIEKIFNRILTKETLYFRRQIDEYGNEVGTREYNEARKSDPNREKYLERLRKEHEELKSRSTIQNDDQDGQHSGDESSAWFQFTSDEEREKEKRKSKKKPLTPAEQRQKDMLDRMEKYIREPENLRQSQWTATGEKKKPKKKKEKGSKKSKDNDHSDDGSNNEKNDESSNDSDDETAVSDQIAKLDDDIYEVTLNHPSRSLFKFKHRDYIKFTRRIVNPALPYIAKVTLLCEIFSIIYNINMKDNRYETSWNSKDMHLFITSPKLKFLDNPGTVYRGNAYGPFPQGKDETNDIILPADMDQFLVDVESDNEPIRIYSDRESMKTSEQQYALHKQQKLAKEKFSKIQSRFTDSHDGKHKHQHDDIMIDSDPDEIYDDNEDTEREMETAEKEYDIILDSMLIDHKNQNMVEFAKLNRQQQVYYRKLLARHIESRPFKQRQEELDRRVWVEKYHREQAQKKKDEEQSEALQRATSNNESNIQPKVKPAKVGPEPIIVPPKMIHRDETSSEPLSSPSSSSPLTSSASGGSSSDSSSPTSHGKQQPLTQHTNQPHPQQPSRSPPRRQNPLDQPFEDFVELSSEFARPPRLSARLNKQQQKQQQRVPPRPQSLYEQDEGLNFEDIIKDESITSIFNDTPEDPQDSDLYKHHDKKSGKPSTSKAPFNSDLELNKDIFLDDDHDDNNDPTSLKDSKPTTAKILMMKPNTDFKMELEFRKKEIEMQKTKLSREVTNIRSTSQMKKEELADHANSAGLGIGGHSYSVLSSFDTKMDLLRQQQEEQQKIQQNVLLNQAKKYPQSTKSSRSSHSPIYQSPSSLSDNDGFERFDDPNLMEKISASHFSEQQPSKSSSRKTSTPSTALPKYNSVSPKPAQPKNSSPHPLTRRGKGNNSSGKSPSGYDYHGGRNRTL